jgi:hypothetical protein
MGTVIRSSPVPLFLSAGGPSYLYSRFVRSLLARFDAQICNDPYVLKSVGASGTSSDLGFSVVWLTISEVSVSLTPFVRRSTTDSFVRETPGSPGTQGSVIRILSYPDGICISSDIRKRPSWGTLLASEGFLWRSCLATVP